MYATPPLETVFKAIIAWFGQRTEFRTPGLKPNRRSLTRIKRQSTTINPLDRSARQQHIFTFLLDEFCIYFVLVYNFEFKFTKFILTFLTYLFKMPSCFVCGRTRNNTTKHENITFHKWVFYLSIIIWRIQKLEL